MVLVGTQAQNLEGTVKSIIKAFILDAFEEEPYLSSFSAFGGIEVLFPENVSEVLNRPTIEIRKSSVTPKNGWRGAKVEGTFYPGKWNEWALELFISADDSTGADTGTSGDTPSDVLLGDALTNLFNDAEMLDELDASGLENVRLEAGSESVQDDIQENLFTLRFWTFSMPGAPDN